MDDIEKKVILKSNCEKNHRAFKKALGLFLVVFLVTAGFFIGYKRGQKQAKKSENKISIEEAFIENKFPNPEKNIDFSLFWKVWDLLKEKHISKNSLNAQDLVYGAINGILKATGDPYSTFFNPEESQIFSEDIEGSFEGIGAELGIKDEILTVVAPLDGSPAQKAGLRSGDKILKVDEKIIADMTIDEAVSVIRGEKGTTVKLIILHEGAEETEEIMITRDTIEIKNLKLTFKDNNVAYLKIIKFSDNIDLELNNAVRQIIKNQSQGIILDLRDNPGGLLDKAVFAASYLIPKDKIVVLEEDNLGNRKSLNTIGGDKLSNTPLVVLINEGSASASEILAGALHDNRDVTLVGKKTFGKGSVQELVDLPGGSSVKITVAKWLTPNGNYIMDTGIDPDVEINLTLDDYKNDRDPQLDKAMEIIFKEINNL